MAFDPANYNLITFKGLTEAFDPESDWLIAIQSPADDSAINYVKASDLLALITGTVNLPDGIISGIDQTVNNLTTPKVLSVSTGQWRIANVAYNNNSIANFNIPTADPTLDRIDRIYLDNTGVNYQIGTAGGGIPSIPAGSIGLVPFTVPSGGGDITEPSPTLSAQYAVMNSLNTGDFDITGAFKINGVPFSAGGGLTTSTILSADLTDIGEGFYSAPLPTLTDDQSIIAMLKIYPDQTDLATYYFKVPEIDGSDLINIEWDGISDIKILLKIG
jgi:hypothetical protein